MRHLTCFFLLLLCFLVISCNGKNLVTISIPASEVGVATETKYQFKDLPDLCLGGLLCDPVYEKYKGKGCRDRYGVPGNANADKPIATGFLYAYQEAGFSACKCWEYINCALRGYVRFDLSQISGKSIVDAKLQYNFDKFHKLGKYKNYNGDCIKSIVIAGSNWKSFKTKGTKLSGDPSNQGLGIGIDISSTVRGWQDGTIPNHGLFFVGYDESLGQVGADNFSPIKRKEVCVVVIENLRLKIITTE